MVTDNITDNIAFLGAILKDENVMADISGP
jgi:hypothetical protein